MILAAVALGLLIGLALGALGGGGSILTVPALVYALGLSAQEATTASLVIVGMTAATGSVSHARSGQTRWGSGVLLALLGVPAAVLGTQLNRAVDPDALLLCFAVVMLLAASGMLARARAVVRAGGADSPREPAPGATTAEVAAERSRTDLAWRLAAAGLGIGFLNGFLGVGGGFVVVPVLVVLLHMPMPSAVGTSLLVIAVNSAVALVARAGHGSFAWSVIVPFTLAAIAGSLAGKRVADRLRAITLTRSFAALLVVVAAYVAIKAVPALV
ncbi:MAG: sulfite exporter TauE/SafE family protein [Mycobacteriales bacterium]|nr:sulfite exporter TauE/SafE family protein [Mycobacteriales bacterium]